MPDSICTLIENTLPDRWFRTAWDQYHPTILHLIKQLDATEVLEIGGGRFPLLKQEEASGLRYTSNDISQAELDRAPNWVETACFNISTPAPTEHHNRYDLIFSCMVQEHLQDTEAAYQTIHSLLKPGGVVLNFCPTLYAFPFVINKLLPETFSRKILQTVFPDRHDDGTPKFPAHYDWCYNSQTVRQQMLDIGFSEADIIGFWGNSYYKKFPVIRDICDDYSRWLMHKQIRTFASFAYMVAMK